MGVVQKGLRSPGTPHPTLSMFRNKAKYETERVEAVQFVNAVLQRPTLHVTTAPTLGRSCDSLSLTTDTTGSYREDTRVSIGHSSFTGSTVKPRPSPIPRRSPVSREAVQPGSTPLSPGEEQP